MDTDSMITSSWRIMILRIWASSVDLDMCEDLVDDVVPSTAPSDTEPSLKNSIARISSVNFIVNKVTTEVVAEEEKKESNAFATDMVIPEPGSKQFMLLQELYTTDQGFFSVMMSSGWFKNLQQRNNSVKELGSGQFVDDVHGRSGKAWIFILCRANQELCLLPGLPWMRSIFEETVFIRDTRKGMG